MLTKINVDNLIAHLQSLPNPELGIPAKQMYDEARKFSITCSEVYQHLVGKSRAVSPGRYTVKLTDELLAAIEAKPVKAPKEPKVKAVKEPKVKTPKPVKEPKAAKEPKAKKVSSLTVETRVPISSEDAEARKNLIASIAKRHKAEKELLEDTKVDTVSEEAAEEHAAAVAEEIKAITTSESPVLA